MKKDYTIYSFILSLIVILLLLAAGMIPSFTLGNITFRKIDILSDLHPHKSTENESQTVKEYSDTSFMAESILAESKRGKPENLPDGLSQDWNISAGGDIVPSNHSSYFINNHPSILADIEDVEIKGDPATRIEDFCSAENSVTNFCNALQTTVSRRPVRIAVLGDSFIEADIITADLREQLQNIYGGTGVGFVPFASPLAKYRRTVKHTFNGWTTYSVVKKKEIPENIKDKFFVSGLVSVPSEGAWSRFEGVNFRKNIKKCSVARLLFINKGQSSIEVIINDTIKTVFNPESSPHIQQINIHGSNISTLQTKITNVEGFIGHGVVLEDDNGISVDNYSIRGNSGMALFATNGVVNAQINKLLGFDLVILQYGLNAMSRDILNYDAYSRQLTKIITYVKGCFPQSAILVMSVGDRSTQQGGEFVTMPAAKAMIKAQLKASKESGVGFWNTFEAMGGERSMVNFVAKRWASKDYTHIGYPGGNYIAGELVKSLVYARQGTADNLISPMINIYRVEEVDTPPHTIYNNILPENKIDTLKTRSKPVNIIKKENSAAPLPKRDTSEVSLVNKTDDSTVMNPASINQ